MNVSTFKLVTKTTEVEVLVMILVIASSVPVSAGFVLECPRSLSGVLSRKIRGLTTSLLMIVASAGRRHVKIVPTTNRTVTTEKRRIVRYPNGALKRVFEASVIYTRKASRIGQYRRRRLLGLGAEGLRFSCRATKERCLLSQRLLTHQEARIIGRKAGQYATTTHP